MGHFLQLVSSGGDGWLVPYLRKDVGLAIRGWLRPIRLATGPDFKPLVLTSRLMIRHPRRVRGWRTDSSLVARTGRGKERDRRRFLDRALQGRRQEQGGESALFSEFETLVRSQHEKRGGPGIGIQA